MFKLALWISLVLMVASLVIVAPLMNPALAAEVRDQQINSVAQQQAVKDEIIATRIDAAYLSDRRLKPYYIEVDVRQGVVTLKGTVGSHSVRELALMIASEQEYVREVRDEIEVREAGNAYMLHTSWVPDNSARLYATATASEDQVDPGQPSTEEESGLGSMLSDASMATKVKTRLLVHFGLTAMAIKVDAKDKVVRLTGTLDDPELLPLVEKVVESTPGVKLVRNELRVEPATSSA